MKTRTGQAVLMAAIVVLAAACGDDSGDSADGGAETAQILVEYDDAGRPIPAADQISVGEAELTRSASGLSATASMDGLVPGGAYTFWLVAYYGGDLTFPDDRFVNHGYGVVADEDGRAEAEMTSDVGDASITGFHVEALGGVAEFPALSVTDSKVRVEIVYHGQADVAGDDLDAWLADFWTGDPNVCADPLGTAGTGAVPEHPYCAGYWGATFDPVEA